MSEFIKYLQNKYRISSGKKGMLIFFYPEDDTYGCTIENLEFSKLHKTILNKEITVFGVSPNSEVSHTHFTCKYGLEHKLVSDEKKELCKLFKVLLKQNVNGADLEEIERSTFLLDNQGSILMEWRKVDARNHHLEVMDKINSLI